MLNLNTDSREIKSFRLRSRIKNLKSFFFKEDSVGIFMFSDSLNPLDRILLREQLSVRNLQVIFYSKTLFSFLLKNKKYIRLNNLLQGDVFLIRNCEGKELTESDIKIILNQNNFMVRFLYWKQSIYRTSKIKDFITISPESKDLKQVPILLLNTVWNNCILNTIQNKYSNYIK